MTNVCSHTGVSRPECSCRACLQDLISQHQPSLLGGTPVVAMPDTGEMPAVGTRAGFFSRLRDLRRAA